jgi:hypothetical protein
VPAAASPTGTASARCVSAVRFHACPAQTRRFTDGKPLGPWTGYPGGFLVDHPGCARLTVTAPGMRTVRRRIALGVAVARCRV